MLFVILSYLIFPAQAAIPSQAMTDTVPTSSVQMPFFKSPQSLFPSGSTSLVTLQKMKVHTKWTQEKFYKWKSQLFKTDEIRPIFPLHLSRYVIDQQTKHRLKVDEARVHSIEVLHPTLKKTVSKPLESLTSDPYDMGVAITLMDAYLKKSPSDEALVLTTIPQGQRLIANKYKNGFVEVNYKTYVGYVRLSEMVTKFDLATMIYAGKSWQIVKKREFDFMITADDKKVHLGDVRGIVTPDQRGLIASSNQKIPLWSQIEIVNEDKPTWIESVIKDHGTVWWKPSNVESEVVYTIDDLLKKEISSVSFHPKNPLKGVLSAHGVYMTDDGFHWKRLLQFEDFNGPVYYFNDLLLFVGHFRSTDGGHHFDNYIQIEKIASAIEYSFGFFPKKLQVKRIETIAPFRLKIEIDTGSRKIKMESPLFAQDWKVFKG
ncbi:MAG: hypothetical protein H7061_14770 [Bdellovibrionaceae bacterium]|nr:hypothetical protein [Bdellovibrio sp.]